MVATPGIGTPPSDKGANLMLRSEPHPIHVGCGALCQPTHWSHPMFELTLKVRLTSKDIRTLARAVVVVLVLLT